LFNSLRTELGTTYSPSVWTYSSSRSDDDGALKVLVETKPEYLPKVEKVIKDNVARIRKELVKTEELENVRKPAINNLAKKRKNINYWEYRLAHTSQEPKRITRIEQNETRLNNVTADSIRNAARRFLLPNKCITIIVKHRDVK